MIIDGQNAIGALSGNESYHRTRSSSCGNVAGLAYTQGQVKSSSGALFQLAVEAQFAAHKLHKTTANG